MNATSRSVFLLVALGFAVQLTWRSPWTIKRQRTYKTFTTICLTIVYVVITGWLFISESREASVTGAPQSNTILSSIFSWGKSRISALSGLPWRWVWLGAATGFLIALIFSRRRGGEEKKPVQNPYQWLHDIADQQAKSIAQHVRLEKPLTYEHRLNEAIPSIGLKFPVRNYSLFDICIDDHIKGEIYYDGTELAEPRIVRYADTNISFMQLGGISIEQRLTVTEASHIAKMEGTFHFSALEITIKGSSDFPQVAPQRLSILDHEHALAMNEKKPDKLIAQLRNENESLKSEFSELANKEMRQYRQGHISTWRKIVNKARQEYDDIPDNRSFKEVLEAQEHYLSLEPILSEETRQALADDDKQLNHGDTIIDRGQRPPLLNPAEDLVLKIARDITRQEKEWHLT